jgi:hypothetical protein
MVVVNKLISCCNMLHTSFAYSLVIKSSVINLVCHKFLTNCFYEQPNKFIPTYSICLFYLLITAFICSIVQQPVVGQGLLIIEAWQSRSFIHTTLGRTPLDGWWARRSGLCLITYTLHKRQTAIPPAEIRTRNPSKRTTAQPLGPVRVRFITK